MAQVIGYVKSLQNGAFFAKDAHGEVRELKAGDQIFKDELVFGAQNNPQNAQVIIDVTLTDASDIVLSGVDQLYADISVIGGSFETEDAVVATDSLENAWKLSTNTTTPDTTTPLEATAAGIEAPAAGLTTADGDRPINGTFYDRTGLIGDVRTTLTQDTVNGGTSQTIARVDTQDYNEQPTVENVTGSVNEALNGLNQITGQLVASDPDAGDTHTFFAVDGSLLINGEPAPEGVVLVLNEDGTYSVTGDFNTLAVGENAVITFQYYAVDDGLEIGETHTSLPATVTITIQGTNDQPVVSDISVNDSGSSEGGIVGYYDMASGQGVSAQVNGITSAGLTAAQLFTLSAEELANIGTLYVQNPSNSNYGSEYLSQLSAIQSAVSNGMTLIIHDRYVTEGAQILPGGESIVFHRLEGNGTNIEIIDSELETGASGNIDDSSLDNGSYSNHGYVDLNSLPEGATVLMTDGDPSHVVTFSYQYGAGTVIYSTIPLDHYLANSGNSGLNANMQIYAANLLEDFAKGNGTIYETRDSTDVIEVDDTTDDGRNVLSGALTVADDDATDTHTFSVVEGSLVIDDTASEAGITAENVNVSIVQVDGVWQYNIDGDFSELAAGEKVTITFQYVADDGEGFDGTDGVNENSVSEPKTITLTITGTNDQPVVENVTLVSQSEAIDGTNTFAGTLAATDADAHDTHEFFVVEESVSVDKEFIGIPSIELNSQTGEYTLTGDFNALAVGESVTVTFSYYAVDSSATQANGESNKSEIKTVTMTIKGTNDAPVAVVDVNSVTEAGSGDIGKLMAEGNLLTNDTDVDHGANLDIASINGVSKTFLGKFVVLGEYGALSVDKATGKYKYVLDNLDSRVDGLDTKETLTETFTYVVTDEHGATSTSTLSITINGTNDAPTIFASTGNWFNVNDTVDESALANGTDQKGTTAIAYGTFTIGDADGLDDIKSISVAGTSFTVSSDNNFADLVGQTVTTEYGEVTIASYSHGTFNYTYTLTSPTTDVKNVTETDSFKVIVSDGDKSDSATVTINITDDAPIAFKDAQTTNEDAVSIYGNVLGNDKVGADGVQSVSFSTTQGTYGTLSYNTATGAYTYTLNPNAQALAQGDSVQEKFTYTVTDGDGDKASSTLAIKVTGTNDAPVATVEEDFGVNEDSIVHGQVVADDIDSDDDSSTLTYSLVGDAPAGFTLNPDGSYTLDASHEAYQSLGVNDEQNVTFTWIATDSHDATTTEQTVTITVKGTNDAPLLDLNGADETYVESFEGLMGDSGWTILGSSSFTGDHGIVWTTTGHNLEIQNNGVTVSAASAGHALAELDSNGLVTLSTTLALNDTTATVAFDYHARPNSDSDSDMKVTLGNSSFTIDNSGTDLVITTTGNISVNYTYNATSGWYSFSVTATGLTVGNNILSFEGTGVSNSLGALIDNIAIKTSNGVGYETSFTENGASVSIADTDVSISDIDDSNIESASIVLTNAQADDFLVYNGMTYNTVDGKITVNITGTATLSAYQEMIKSVTYGSTSENPDTTDRVIEVVVNDGNANSNTATTVVHVTAINDAPVAIDDSYSYLGENLIINGSFEDINGVDDEGKHILDKAPGSLTGTSLVHMKSITGWELESEGLPAMEPHAGGHAGVGTTDGAHYMDLGASPGNSAISQTIGGLTEGSLYQFSVDYRDKALMQGEGEASGVMQILWNGVVVATVQGNNTQAWEKLTLNLTAQNGDNTLTFKEIGTSNDNAGMAIDNVQLKSINTALVTDEDTALTIMPATLLGNDTDLDGDTLSISSVQNATHGTVEIVDGNVVFTPEANYNGVATFTYTISDNNGGTDTATVTLYVNPVNDAPITSPITLAAIAEDTTVGLVITQEQLLANASDLEGDTLVATGLTISAGNGTLVDNGNGTWTYTPASNDDTSVSFSYTISDGTKTVAGSATLDITPVNDAPVFGQASYSFNYNENSASGATLGTVNATDVDSATLTYSITGGNSNNYFTVNATTGVISLTTAGAASFVNDYESGANTHTLTVGVSDGSTTKYVSVTLNEQNIVEATATADHIITNAGTALFTIPEWALLANDSGTSDITAVSNKSDLTTVTLNSDSITVRDDSNHPFYPDGGSFDYTADGSTAHVTVEQDTWGDLNGTSDNDILIGSNSRDDIYGGNGNDILIGGSGNDWLLGEAGNDTLVYDVADSRIDGGSGKDTLLFTQDTNINFQGLNSSNDPIFNMEVLDLSKANVNLTNLSLSDVIDITENGKLTILGGVGDTVDFAGNGWSRSATPVIETVNGASHTFDVYTNAGDPTVVVKVEQNINDTI